MSTALYNQVRELHDRGAQLAGVEALQEEQRVLLTYYFLLEGKNERLAYETTDGSCPSIIQIFGSADYIERSLHTSHGLKFIGNPNLEVGL